ncbi:MAG TPA: aldehyde dehydrogenase family protein, partial [Polyangiaceae bacterium]|nr:aldehyde dehydrogenase family protein [Polyangiaceae bacterium]
AACELIDFFRFTAHFAERLTEEQPLSAAGERNRLELRPLEGFVYAVTPFNFTSIAANLPSVAALLGNVVLWKPSPHSMLSAHAADELLRAAGLPEGVVQLVPGDAEEVTREVLGHRDFAGLNFTGSTKVFHSISQQIAERLPHYKNLPRLVGETGGKDFIVAHSSAELDELAVAIVRGGFEYQGQKCSAASRVYVPRSLSRALESRLQEMISALRVGDPADFSCFMGAVIGRAAFDRIAATLERAKQDDLCRVIAGGGASDAEGFFIEPTLVEVSAPQHPLMKEEIFGPVVALFVYEDDRYEEVLSLCDATSPYALTGAVFARDRKAVDQALVRLRYAAGNFYINDKPTGAVVGQQPFGGGRHSGTNDKAGSAMHLWRWVSPRIIKENFRPPRDFRYPILLPV